MMDQPLPRNVAELFFPVDTMRAGAAPTGAQLDAMAIPWSLRELRDAGETALMGLFERGQKQTARALMSQLDDRASLAAIVGRHREEFYGRRNDGSLSDLQVAILNGDHASAVQLLRDGAAESSALPSLHAASFEGGAEMIGALVEAGAAVGALNTQGESAAWIAAAAGNDQALEALLRHGADPRLPNKDGVTPLMVAIANMSAPCAELLIPVSDLHAKDAKGLGAGDHAPNFHADPDDPDFEDMLRYARLLQSLQEATELSCVARSGRDRESRSL